jgi:hypothetical protein
MQHLHFFQKVKTPHGVGTLVNINCPFNGLYYEPDRAKCVVWYGMNNIQSGLVVYEYDYNTILELNNLRKEKLEKIFGKKIK